MPGNFQFPACTELWVPAVPPEGGPSEHAVIGRLKPEVTLAQAQAALDANAQAIEARTPGARGWFGVQAVPLTRQTIPAGTRTIVQILFAAALVLVVVGCADAAQLLVVRALQRTNEVAVRTAGATRARLAREALLESAILSAAAAAIAVALSATLVRMIRAWARRGFPGSPN